MRPRVWKINPGPAVKGPRRLVFFEKVLDYWTCDVIRHSMSEAATPTVTLVIGQVGLRCYRLENPAQGFYRAQSALAIWCDRGARYLSALN